jgi:mRNA-degrading endonuclease RelE of RelBE toxin-antitoxin system
MMAAAGRSFKKLRAPEHVRELLRSAHPQIKRKLRTALAHIQSEPDAGKALRDELRGLRSFRVGRLRIIYRVPKSGCIDIVAIGPRKTVYEETFRLVQRQASKL